MTDSVLPQNPSERIPASRRDWTRLMSDLQIRPNKGLGQHFLFERGIVERMVRVAGVTSSDTVVEIGPGLGILTSELLRKAGHVVAIELDRNLAAHLRRTFGDLPNLTLVENNVMSVDLDLFLPPSGPYDVVANLPYSLGSAILRHLLESPRPPRRLTIMLQKEVAERVVASPPDMSILAVATQFYAKPYIAFDVSPTVFIPPPKVESAVLTLEVHKQPPLPQRFHPLFFRIVTAGFRQKRKQVANSIADVLRLPKTDVSQWLELAGIDPMRRAETLAVADWVRLTETAPAAVTAG
ncbi:MAG: 16S rRNA (adenine(1518)-N(6)/adenine(1519)-N(6))-dimethyltransferase RsmA [Thermomicrobiales bacterium]